MLNIYRSKKAAIRFAKNTYGDQWANRVRYLEVALPDDEMLCIIQAREKPIAARANLADGNRSSQASKRSSGGITQRCQAIFDLLQGQPRAALIAECVKQGAAASTAATQYQRWRKANKAKAS